VIIAREISRGKVSDGIIPSGMTTGIQPGKYPEWARKKNFQKNF
jgi:hypothetical protein